LRIGIIETGQVRAELKPRHGNYPDMFVDLLGGLDSRLRFSHHDAVQGALPGNSDDCDAWLITGSRFTAFERAPWMQRLEDFLRRQMQESRPVIGVCFGHQILAQAMGGKVERASAWGLGIHSHDLRQRREWMDDAVDPLRLCVVHQDQVVRLPESVEVIAGSDFCPNAVLAYGDRALTFQAHPEFSPTYVADLVGAMENELPAATTREARAALSAPGALDRERAASWILRFLNRGRKRA
jgi:GMP synthase-like glutamine amidotransferase